MIHPLHYFADRRGRLPRVLVMLAFAMALGISWCGWRFFWAGAKGDPLAGPNGAPVTRTVDEPAGLFAVPVDLMAAADFKLSMGDGSGWHGYNTIKIAADGQCRYVFIDHSVGWRRGEFVIDPKTLLELRRLLVEIDFFRLKKEYHANICDGTQRWAWVQACGMQKRIYCNNHFPKPFQKLYEFVQEKVIRAHEREFQNAVVIDFQEARHAAAGY